MIIRPDDTLLGYLVFNWKKLYSQYNSLHEIFNKASTTEEKRDIVTKATTIVKSCNKLGNDILRYVQLCKELNEIFKNKEEDKKKDKIEEISKFEEYLATTYRCPKYINMKNKDFSSKPKETAGKIEEEKKEPVAPASKGSDEKKEPIATSKDSDEKKEPVATSKGSDEKKEPVAASRDSDKKKEPVAATSKEEKLEKGRKYKVKEIVKGIEDGILGLGSSAIAVGAGVLTAGSISALLAQLSAGTTIAMILGVTIYGGITIACAAVGITFAVVAITRIKNLIGKFGKNKGATKVSKKRTLKK